MGQQNRCRILQSLRSFMRDQKHVTETLDAYIVPSEDAHQSEYIAKCDERRAFLSGFTGSRGLAAVSHGSAAMWTDGRYFLQAGKEMGEEWVLMKEKVPGTPSLTEWLCDQVPLGGRVGVDPFLMAVERFDALKGELGKKGVHLVAVAENLVDLAWGAARPPTPSAPLIVLPVQYTGMGWREKISTIRKEMREKKSQILVISALDEVAWTFNLRGADIDFNPVFFSYALIGLDFISLFLHEDKVAQDIRQHFDTTQESSNGHKDGDEYIVTLLPYSSVLDYLDKFLKDRASMADQRVWVPPESTSYALASLVPPEKRCDEQSPVARMKALKNPTEMMGMRNAHLRDAVAHCEFLYWIQHEMEKANPDLTELSAATKFEELRKQQKDYVSLSFGTISSTGSNASVIHYCVTPESDVPLQKDQLYLIDSGGQYKDGTTDVTRTIAFKEPSSYQRECFTRVLKGHIRLAMQNFPQGTPGIQLDALARSDLWEVGLDYRHGTGHGVGHFLNVHEGPQSVGFRSANTWKEGVKENMVLTIEPGYYEDGEFGIRIENVYGVVAVATAHRYQDIRPLSFDAMTLVPIQKQMLEPSLLTEREIEWLNQYHSRCRDEVGPLLEEQGKHTIYKWLEEQTQPLG